MVRDPRPFPVHAPRISAAPTPGDIISFKDHFPGLSQNVSIICPITFFDQNKSYGLTVRPAMAFLRPWKVTLFLITSLEVRQVLISEFGTPSPICSSEVFREGDRAWDKSFMNAEVFLKDLFSFSVWANSIEWMLFSWKEVSYGFSGSSNRVFRPLSKVSREKRESLLFSKNVVWIAFAASRLIIADMSISCRIDSTRLSHSHFFSSSVWNRRASRIDSAMYLNLCVKTVQQRAPSWNSRRLS